jgi:hypothetical protein
MRVVDIRRWPCGTDAVLCQRALDQLIRRHSILRTRYVKDAAGNRWAVTENDRHVKLGFADLSAVDEAQQSERIRELARSMRAAPFNHETGPLLRISLVKRSDTEYVSVLVVCHSIFDAWSLRVLFADLAALYQAELTGQAPALKPLRQQYRDFARQRTAYLGSELAHAHVPYWTDRITQHLRDPIRFEPDRRTPVEASAQRPAITGRIGQADFDALQARARACNTTVFHCVAVAVGMTLARRTGGKDLFSWVALTTRSSVDYRRMIGHFIDSTPLLIRIREDISYAEACDELRRASVESMRHSDVTPALLAPMLGRIRAATPFTSTVINYVAIDALSPPASAGAEHSPPLDGSSRMGEFGLPAHYDERFPLPVGFEFCEVESELWWTIPYKVTLYEDSTIESLSAQLAKLLCAAGRDPRLRLSDL